jgi:threonine/homoserine/homoserine lactone efflux protein
MSPEILAVFFATACLLALTPGPDNLFVLSQALAFGARAGLLVTLGLCSGLVGHTALVAAGVAAVIAASSLGLWLIKTGGAVYLLYLAWQSWFAADQASIQGEAQPLSGGRLYRRGIVMNLTNPKVSLFFIAFLPQFISPQGMPVEYQVVVLGGLFILSTLLVFGAIALLSGYFHARVIASSSVKKILMNRLVSLVFVALAVNLWIFQG